MKLNCLTSNEDLAEAKSHIVPNIAERGEERCERNSSNDEEEDDILSASGGEREMEDGWIFAARHCDNSQRLRESQLG